MARRPGNAGIVQPRLPDRQGIRLNLNLLYQPLKAVDISAAVYDLLGDYKLDPAEEGIPLMPQEGRTFRLKLEYRF